MSLRCMLIATPEEVEEMRRRHWLAAWAMVMLSVVLNKYTEYFAEMRERRKELVAKPEMVEDVLRDGANRAESRSVTPIYLVPPAWLMGGPSRRRYIVLVFIIFYPRSLFPKR